MNFAPTQAWLINARYYEDKKAVAVEFSHLDNKRMVRLPFFPSFYVGMKNFSLKGLEEAIGYDRRRFKVKEEGAAFKVVASTFSDLNEIAEVLFRETGFRALVLKPERQFLFERGWSFFDCFTFFSEGEYAKSDLFHVPEAKLGFFSESLKDTVLQLVEESPELGLNLVESIVLSNILGVDVSCLPEGDFFRKEALFEKIFWKLGLSVNSQVISCKKSSCFPRGFAEKNGLAEVDFSLLWSTLLSRPVFNLGPDSLNCSCCKPGSVSDSNVLPDSLISVEFLQDGFFFESFSRVFAGEFHESRGGKESRLRRMKEFCLKRVPCGPFFRFEKHEIPLVDAVALKRDGMVRVVGSGKVSWFCRAEESVVSKEVCSLNGVISVLESECESLSSSFLKKHGVLGPVFLSKDVDFLFSKARLGLVSGFLRSLPGHLCNERSGFFDKRTCFAIEAVEARVFESFREFAGRSDCRVVAVSEEKAYVSGNRPYSLIKRFSEAERVPGVLKARIRPLKQAF